MHHAEGLGGGADELRASLERAQDQALRTGEIVKRLRAFVQRGEAEPGAEQVDRIVGEGVALLSTLAQQRGIELHVALPGASARVFADRVQIQQVLVNLMRNGIEALHRSDQQTRLLHVCVRRVRDSFEFVVEDNGPGIRADSEPMLFSRFTTSTGDGGMGVGLSISRRIIEAHGSELKYRRSDLGGARFSFSLPSLVQPSDE